MPLNPFDDFPSLPLNQAWPANVSEAYHILEQLHLHITAILRQEENDPVRLSILRQEIFSKAMPLLQSLPTSSVPQAWIVKSVSIFGALALLLRDAMIAADGMCVDYIILQGQLAEPFDRERSTVAYPVVVTSAPQTGRPGRPRYDF